MSKNSAIAPAAGAKIDRRAARTGRTLHQALHSLILEKGYEATTITDIVTHADVGRSTFYAHHSSKEGLLVSGLQHLRSLLVARQREAQTASASAPEQVLGFSYAFFKHVHEYRDILNALAGNAGELPVRNAIKRLLADLIGKELASAKTKKTGDEIPRDAVVQYIVDAFFSVLAWWFQRSPQLSPAEADAIFRRLTLPALSAIGISAT